MLNYLWDYLFKEEQDFLQPEKVLKSLVRERSLRAPRKSAFLDFFKKRFSWYEVYEEVKKVVTRLLKECSVEGEEMDLSPIMDYVHPRLLGCFSFRTATEHEKFVSEYTTKSKKQVTLVIGENVHVGVLDKAVRSGWDCCKGRKRRYSSEWVYQIDLRRWFTEVFIISEVLRYYEETLKSLSLEERLENVVFKKAWDREINREIRVRAEDVDYKVYLDSVGREYTETSNSTYVIDVYSYLEGNPIQLNPSYNKMPREIFVDILEEYLIDKRRDEYNREVASDYAQSFMDLKNVPQKYTDAAKESAFAEYFGNVEFDPDVDIEKMDTLGKEFKALMSLFDADFSKCQIRFRKLGHHKAIGLYYPVFGCLCVDIRAPRSYIHEMFHLLDFENGELSSKSAFYPIREKYEERLRENLIKLPEESQVRKVLNGKTKYNLDYYLTPTEIFARCGEVFCYKHLGIRNSLIGEESEYTKIQYNLGEELEKSVIEYFTVALKDFLKEEEGGVKVENRA